MYTSDSRWSCRLVYQDFFKDVMPSLKASLRLHRMSSGIRFSPLNESLRRCFSTPSWSSRMYNTVHQHWYQGINNMLPSILLVSCTISSPQNMDKVSIGEKVGRG